MKTGAWNSSGRGPSRRLAFQFNRHGSRSNLVGEGFRVAAGAGKVCKSGAGRDDNRQAGGGDLTSLLGLLASKGFRRRLAGATRTSPLRLRPRPQPPKPAGAASRATAPAAPPRANPAPRPLRRCAARGLLPSTPQPTPTAHLPHPHPPPSPQPLEAHAQGSPTTAGPDGPGCGPTDDGGADDALPLEPAPSHSRGRRPPPRRRHRRADGPRLSKRGPFLPRRAPTPTLTRPALPRARDSEPAPRPAGRGRRGPDLGGSWAAPCQAGWNRWKRSGPQPSKDPTPVPRTGLKRDRFRTRSLGPRLASQRH